MIDIEEFDIAGDEAINGTVLLDGSRANDGMGRAYEIIDSNGVAHVTMAFLQHKRGTAGMDGGRGQRAGVGTTVLKTSPLGERHPLEGDRFLARDGRQWRVEADAFRTGVFMVATCVEERVR